MDSNLTKRNDDLIEIDLSELIGQLWHKAWILFLSMVLVGGIGFCISTFVVTPKYESTTSIYIQAKDSEKAYTYSDAQLASQLTKDYEKLITGRYVLDKVIEIKSLEYGYKDLSDQISVKNIADTRIIEIMVKDKNPYQAQVLANSIREVAAEHIKNVTNVEAVNVVNEADLPTEPAEPSIFLWTVLGGIIGLFICAAIITVRYLLDDTIKTSEDVEKYLELSTLAIIPKGTYKEAEIKTKVDKNLKKETDIDKSDTLEIIDIDN